MLGILTRPAKTPKRFQEDLLAAVTWFARLPGSRNAVSLRETYVLRKALARPTMPGPAGRSLGYLFGEHEPGNSAKAGFEYQGLLFFDEIVVRRHPRYSWQSVPTTNEMHTHEHE